MAKKKLLIVLICIIAMLSFSLTGCGGSEPAGTSSDTASNNSGAAPAVTYKLTFAQQLPSGNSFEQYYFEPFYEKVKEKTNGAVEIEYFAGGALLDGSGMLDGVISGVADIGMIINSYSVGRFPETYFFDLPGLGYKSARAASYAIDEYLKTYKPKEFDDFVTLSVFGCGPGVLTSKNPIHTLEDMKGKQVRAQSAAALGIAALGATPVNMVVAETYEALRNGLVDSNLIAVDAAYSFKLYEVTDNMTLYPFSNTVFSVIMNKDSFAKLPEDIQSAILEAAAETFDESGSYYFDLAANFAIDYVKDYGIDVYSLSDEEQAKWEAALASVLDNYAAELTSKGYNGEEILKNVRALVDKYNEMYPERATELDQ